MRTPVRSSLKQFNDELEEYLRMKCIKLSEEDFICRECGNKIESIIACMSVHSVFFKNCAGAGRTIFFDIPYCPQCEEKPSESGCFHQEGLD